MKFFKLLFLVCLLLSFAACDDEDTLVDVITGNEPVDVTGITYAEAEDQSLATIYTDVRTALADAEPITIVAEVDHSRSAANAGFALRPTRVILFGNPALGTPLMQQNMMAGLDLPQKIVFYQAEDDDVIVAYNSTEYLASRHGLTDDGELTMIGNALSGFVEDNTGENVANSADVRVDRDAGIVTATSDDDVATVYGRLRAAVSANTDLTIVAELDHAANAASVDMELPPSRLIVFGNPRVGTPFMLDEQAAGLDLPVKMLVFDNGNGTTIAYNDPAYLADRFDIDDDLPAIATMRTALQNFADAAMDN